MILYDRATAEDLIVALRLLEGRLVGTGRSLSPGALEIRAACQVSLGVRAGHPLACDGEGPHDGNVLELLTYDDVGSRLQVSQSTVKRLVKNGTLPTVSIGSSSRVRPADLAAYIVALSDRESA